MKKFSLILSCFFIFLIFKSVKAQQNSDKKITYDLIDHHNAKPGEWDQSIIAIIDGDTLNVPLPSEPSDLTYSVKGDLNGNGYNDLVVVSGTFGELLLSELFYS